MRTAFRWAADHGDLDDAAAIATYAAFLGYWVENYEPIAWAEELIEPACAVDHPRLAFLYVMASQCIMSGRVDAAVRYREAAMAIVESGRGEVPFGIEGLLGQHVLVRQPSLNGPSIGAAAGFRAVATRNSWARVNLILSLAIVQSYDEAIATTTGLIEAAEATRQSVVAVFRTTHLRAAAH